MEKQQDFPVYLYHDRERMLVYEREHILESAQDILALVETCGYQRNGTVLGTSQGCVFSIYARKPGFSSLFYEYILVAKKSHHAFLVFVPDLFCVVRYVQNVSSFLEKLIVLKGVSYGGRRTDSRNENYRDLPSLVS